MRTVAAICILALSPAAAGCGSERAPPQVPAPRSLASKCGDAGGISARPSWLRTSDGVRLYAIEAGRGSVGVVLVHESPADLCGWTPLLPSLTRAGFHVLALDLRGFGDSQAPQSEKGYHAYDRDLRAATAYARARGAKRVFLVGASFGGATVLTYGRLLDVGGVISLSGETSLPGARLNALAAITRLRSPLLIVGSRHDHYLSVRQALVLLRRAGSKDKRIALYPGGFHGWEIVEDAPYAAKARALVFGWIRARSAS
jgi:alpha-beta hydrolase superfamily lysophospholipase